MQNSGATLEVAMLRLAVLGKQEVGSRLQDEPALEFFCLKA